MPNPTPVSWVRYHAQEVLISLLGLSPRAELAHRRLCDVIWSGGAWPQAHGAAVAKLARVPVQAWPEVLLELRSVGWRQQGRQLTNPAVARLRREAERFHAMAVTRARRGGEALAARRRSAAPPLEASLKHASGKLKPCPVRVRVRSEKIDTTLNKDERLTLIVSARKKTTGKAEQQFLADVDEALAAFSPAVAKQELANWGGWWRNRYRENPQKAERVLAEIRGMVREGKIDSNPGAAALDLWGRLP